VIAEIARRHHPKRADGRQRAAFRSAYRVLAVASVVDNVSFASAWKVEVPHEDVMGIGAARIAAALRPSLVITITRVGFWFLVARTRTAAKMKPAIIVTIAVSLVPVARIVVPLAWIVAPSRVIEHRHLR
jgi:hypothetical protein